MSSAPVRLLVVDDQQLMRDGIASLLSLQDGVCVVGTAADGQDALDQVGELSPDVVLMDVRMPRLDGVAATERLLVDHPDCRVLVLTTFDDDEYVLAAMRAGAVGYLLKDIPVADLAQAVRAAHAGVVQLDPEVARGLVDTLGTSSGTAPPRPAGLTEREVDVVRLVGRGATNQEIAAELFLSEGTVKNHVSSVLRRLGVRDRAAVVVFAHEHGMV